MNYLFLLIFCSVLTTVAMEQEDSSSNNTYDYILPFWHDDSVPVNAIDEIHTLANEGAPSSSHRDESRDNLEQGKGKNEKKNDQDKNSSDLMEKFPNIPLGTIPFKPLIHCGVGYTALLTVSLDHYFMYTNSFYQSKKKLKKIYQANNCVNSYYILNLLNQISAVYVNKMVDQLHTDYTDNILLPKSVTTGTYKDKAQILIKSKDVGILTSCSKSIDQLIVYQNDDLLRVYTHLKNDAAESLLQILLLLYDFWKYNAGMNVMKVLPEHMNLFLEVSAVKHMANNREEVQNAFNILIEQIKLVLQQPADCLDGELTKAIHDKKDQKCIMLHNFLYVLNRYVYNLIAVPISTEKNNRLVTRSSVKQKRKKNTDPDSFFEKHNKAIKVTKYIGLTVLIIGLLYRLIKNNKHYVASKSHF